MVTINVPPRTGNYGPEVSASIVETVKQGWDEVVEAFTVPLAALPIPFPRNAALDPVAVLLPDVTPGNTLEIEWDATLGNAATDAAANIEISAVVQFQGAAAYPANYFFALNSNSGGIIAASGGIESMSGRVAVTIPAGATKALVKLIYVSTHTVDVTGVAVTEGSNQRLGLNLKASEYRGGIAQAGPGTLLAVV